MVEIDETSWHKCLRIVLELLESNIKKAKAAAKAGAQVVAETNPLMPMDVDTQPSVPATSKRPAADLSPWYPGNCKNTNNPKSPSQVPKMLALAIPLVSLPAATDPKERKKTRLSVCSDTRI
ncbi:uncharacterized protein BJ212DRAFT_1297311 [Suillus subaureus]|uniref:Uncharacterized protein n=1 Tax=Suillus subaureus TaxID=48587 RepID=A0A9P7EHR8_9AGAM|nr:uncharacterized protein BJ212DRAFT_1297311 [Suillus subaureus]KAG1822072.1 hypothetical protein BJ212DRAFT_1297311 [Suillus subaureus]